MTRRATIAVDAMGGDKAPGEIVAGALQAVDELDVDVLLAGREEEITPLLPGGALPERVEIVDAREIVAMDEEPATAARAKKDSSLVRAAQAVKEGRAQAMVGAGNTGATMAAALLKMGRIRGIARPAIAVPIPVPGSRPQLLIDGGSTVDCSPAWLAQFARMGRDYARTRLGVDEPSVGLLSNGEEPGKGDELRKQAYPLLEKVDGFVGNVEGRDLMKGDVDVVVTDGFTGNVALKSLEGALRAAVTLVFDVLESTPEAREAAKVVTPMLLAAAVDLDPDATGGAALLGVDGVCVISHGSSSARAIVNATRLAAECVGTGMVARLKEAIHAG
ncbi:MAG: phosphate acyltransferase PlsX [Acidimicrobiia bacterium]